MAEREGFEPSKRISPLTRLAGERLKPLGHLSEPFKNLWDYLFFDNFFSIIASFLYIF